MLLYIGIAIWPLIVQWIYLYRPLSFGKYVISRNKHLILGLLPIVVLLAFRSGEMGADTGTYMRNFTYMIDTTLESAMEISRMETGYLIFVKLITYVTHDPLVYQIICVTCMFIGIFDFLKQLDDDAFLFIYFYCTLGLFFFMFTGTRQCLAMSICLFSYKYLNRKQYLKFLLCLVVAFLFHKSSILFVVVLLIYSRKISILNTFCYFSAACIAGRYLTLIQEWINDAFDYTYEIESTNSGIVYLAVLILLTVFSLIMIYNRFHDLNCNQAIRSLININFITVFFWIMRLQTRVAERPSYYFLFFSCALYASALNSIEDSRYRQAYKLIVCGFALLLYIYRLRVNFTTLIPYEFYCW